MNPLTGQIVLAPMEGVLDPLMRQVITRIGGIDLCVTEFVRVTDTLLPASVFRRYAPELATGGRTAAGVPVIVQLLGSRPDMLARNAERAAALGAPGIDLNFGCPAKTVNRHRGGALLLDTPEDVYQIVHAVRAAVPAHVPVTAKMRLGYQDKTRALENAEAVAAAGADGLSVHARTKVEGYKPPAHWQWIARIREQLTIPVTANGEVWSWDDYQRCRELSGCEHVMIGRGLIARPGLAREIKARRESRASPGSDWPEAVAAVREYLDRLEQAPPAMAQGRIKQWIHMMKREHPEAAPLFERIKKLREIPGFRAALASA
jgi:tRNA-dihydrouridine synthase C